MLKKLRDPLSAVSHYIGAILSIIAIVVVSLSKVFGFDVQTSSLVSTLIFAVSMFLLYMASGSKRMMHLQNKTKELSRRQKNINKRKKM